MIGKTPSRSAICRGNMSVVGEVDNICSCEAENINRNLIISILFLGMSVMENTLLRMRVTCVLDVVNPERSEGGSGGGTELYTSTSRGGKEGTPRVLEVVESSLTLYSINFFSTWKRDLC